MARPTREAAPTLQSGDKSHLSLAKNTMIGKIGIGRFQRSHMKQTDLFIEDTQEELFDEVNYAPPVYHPDPEKVRVRLYNILAEARAASTLPWDARRVGLYRTIFPQMTLSLPDDEATQLRFAFAEELARLKAA
jgi:hypothetical protein